MGGFSRRSLSVLLFFFVLLFFPLFFFFSHAKTFIYVEESQSEKEKGILAALNRALERKLRARRQSPFTELTVLGHGGQCKGCGKRFAAKVVSEFPAFVKSLRIFTVLQEEPRGLVKWRCHDICKHYWRVLAILPTLNTTRMSLFPRIFFFFLK